ncbi:helix-turn-helix domain-containing protein [Mesorhizobium ventifaucium]|uniref:helix-turn-helix domain-containing protein n=1 Tax=Mesorhizobium ventifaucium TaxID=666020 RepID=UPI0020A829BD|nr:helix-turn-helix transcriptional regulator [Mesorhizobium ventifaucium]
MEFYAQADFCLSALRRNVSKMKIDEKIRAILNATHWTQQKLAEYFDVSQSTVHRWLSGAEPEGPRRDAINEAYDKFVSRAAPVESAQGSWLRRIQQVFDRLDGAPEGLFRQIISYAEGVADTYERTRETAARPES